MLVSIVFGENLHTIQNAVVEGETRQVQAEVLVSAESDCLHEVQVEQFEYEARMQHNTLIAEHCRTRCSTSCCGLRRQKAVF